MGKDVILTSILVFLIVFDVSDAALSEKFRKLVASPPNEAPIKPDSPIPSPVKPGKNSGLVGGEEKVKEKKQIGPPPAGEGSKQVSKDTHTPPVTPPTGAKEHNDTPKEVVKDKEKEEEKKEEEKEKVEEKKEEEEENKEKEKEKRESKSVAPVGGYESCGEMEKRCQDLKSMTACIKSYDHADSKSLILIIQNKGDSSLKVNVPALSSGSKPLVINVPRNQSKQVKMSGGGINEITLDAGNGYCVLTLGAPVVQGNFFQLLPSYSKFVTPIYGAYLMLLVTLIAGGVFACCCWFRKRKGQRDIPYQELEMSMPESAVAVDTAEGWDEVWDDDWDEENAVRSPGGRRIAANGLTPRNMKKDDWEDWDD